MYKYTHRHLHTHMHVRMYVCTERERGRPGSNPGAYDADVYIHYLSVPQQPWPYLISSIELELCTQFFLFFFGKYVTIFMR